MQETWEWDEEHEDETHLLFHYSPKITVPLDMDEGQHLQVFISNFLWSLMARDKEPQDLWRPPWTPHLHQTPPVPMEW